MAYSHIVMVILGEDDGRVKVGEWGPGVGGHYFLFAKSFKNFPGDGCGWH